MKTVRIRSDRELVAAAQTGSMNLQNGAELEYSLNSGLTGNSNDAEDVIQEALLRSFLKLSTLKEPYNLCRYFYRVLVSKYTSASS